MKGQHQWDAGWIGGACACLSVHSFGSCGRHLGAMQLAYSVPAGSTDGRSAGDYWRMGTGIGFIKQKSTLSHANSGHSLPDLAEQSDSAGAPGMPPLNHSHTPQCSRPHPYPLPHSHAHPYHLSALSMPNRFLTPRETHGGDQVSTHSNDPAFATSRSFVTHPALDSDAMNDTLRSEPGLSPQRRPLCRRRRVLSGV